MLKLILKSMRPHQWSKNFLLFIPALLAFSSPSESLVIRLVLGLICFSLCASSVYLLNDICDREADKNHPTKKTRPIASGKLSVSISLWASFFLLLISFLGAYLLDRDFFFILIFYYLTTLAYSLILKKYTILDVLILAGLFNLRLFAGGPLAGVAISHWFFLFSFFTFLSLGVMKRFVECYKLRKKILMVGQDANHGSQLCGRGYMAKHANLLQILGLSSAMISTMVFSLYVFSPRAIEIYSHPFRLIGVVPLLIYFHGILWFTSTNENFSDDPVAQVIKSKKTYIIIFLIAGIALWAR